MSKSELHDWECEIEELSGNNADKMLEIAQDIYNTAFVRGKNRMTWEQQPCEDCVSREELKKWLDMNFSFGGALRKLELFDRLDKELPSVTSKPKWIPVSERLPEESLNSVIGWDTYRERCVFVQYIDGYFQITGNDNCFDIVAWMPLPKAYKEEKENE